MLPAPSWTATSCSRVGWPTAACIRPSTWNPRSAAWCRTIADDTWRLRIRKLKRLLSAYTANRDLIAIGAYQRGSDPATDEALARWPEIVEFLGQDVHKASLLSDSLSALQQLVEPEN